MSEHCVVRFTDPAESVLGKLYRDHERLASIQSAAARIEEQGWKLSTNSQAIKVLRNHACIGEIRVLGRGGYRLFFFWHDEGDVRTLWVCHLLPKKDVTSKRRLNQICDSVEDCRERFYREGV